MQNKNLVSSVSKAAMVALVSVTAACGGGGDSTSGATTVPAEAAVASTAADETAIASTVPIDTAATEGACTYTDAGNGALLEGEIGTILTDSRGSTYDVTSGCELVFVECRYAERGGEAYAGAPLSTFTDSEGRSLLFADDCVVAADPAAESISQELIDTCASLVGTMSRAIDNGEWSCADIPLGETKDRYSEVADAFVPYCASPSVRTSGILSAGAPWSMGVSCSPPEAFVSPELSAACVAVGGTIEEAFGSDFWTCGQVPLGDTTDRYGEVEAALAPFCVVPAQFTSGLQTSEAPWFAGWSCAPPV